ncbi:hypothetical protein Ciccas_004561, partial [Cichlidogyrus casuarinus]
MRCLASLLCVILHKFPAEISSRQKLTSYPELAELYNSLLKSIHDAFQQFTDTTAKSHGLLRLQSAFLFLSVTQQVPTHPHAFVDRCIVQLIRLTHRLIVEESNSKSTTPSAMATQSNNVALVALAAASVTDLESSLMVSNSVDLLIISLEMLKCRLNIMTHEMRKNGFGPDLSSIIERSREPKLVRAVIRIIKDWVNVPKNEEHYVPNIKEMVSLFEQLWLSYPRWVNFLKHFLEGSRILLLPESEAPDNSKSQGPDLLTRLLFLIFNNTWDEAHFKELFWLPIFNDVLLCLLDTGKSLQFGGCKRPTEADLLQAVANSRKFSTDRDLDPDDDALKKQEEMEDLKLLNSLSPAEMHELLIKQLARFLMADEHVNSMEQVQASPASLVQGFLTTPDSLTSFFSAPLLTYVAQNFNQWHNIALFLERQTLSASAAAQQEERENTLGLVNVYEKLGDWDHCASAWSLRLDSSEQAIVSFLKALQIDQPVRALDWA